MNRITDLIPPVIIHDLKFKQSKATLKSKMKKKTSKIQTIKPHPKFKQSKPILKSKLSKTHPKSRNHKKMVSYPPHSYTIWSIMLGLNFIGTGSTQLKAGPSSWLSWRNEKACNIAWTGHDRESGIYERGMETTLSRNWIVLLHLTLITTPQEWKWKISWIACQGRN